MSRNAYFLALVALSMVAISMAQPLLISTGPGAYPAKLSCKMAKYGAASNGKQRVDVPDLSVLPCNDV